MAPLRVVNDNLRFVSIKRIIVYVCVVIQCSMGTVKGGRSLYTVARLEILLGFVG